MSKKFTTIEFIERAAVVHNNKYIYPKVNYVNMKVKIVITCKIHGDFEQSPSNHLAGKGCAKCRNEVLSKAKRKSLDVFIIEANKKHNNIYDYSKAAYKNTDTKILITCPIHGDWEQIPYTHLNGVGCPSCKNERLRKKFSLGLDKFIVAANIKHNYRYTYKNTKYVNTAVNVCITCPIHGDFEQSPSHHLNGSGCPSCSKSGFDPSKPAYLYYLKITTQENGIVYKIGITNLSVNERFNLIDLNKIEILSQNYYQDGKIAYKHEQKILKAYKQYRYIGKNILQSGNTELFTEDIRFLQASI